MYIILTWSFPGVDSFTFFLSLIISSPFSSTFNKSFASITSDSWRMSVTSFTGISSLGVSNLSPVSFSKCNSNLSLVIVVPPVPLCPLLHSFLRAAYSAPVFPTLLAASHSSITCTHHCFSYFRRLLRSLFITALSSSFSCRIYSSISPTLAPLLSAAQFLHSVQHIISCWIWLILAFCCSLPSCILLLPYLLVYLLSSHCRLCSSSSHPFWCVSPSWHVL